MTEEQKAKKKRDKNLKNKIDHMAKLDKKPKENHELRKKKKAV